jgi:hypothetical protein
MIGNSAAVDLGVARRALGGRAAIAGGPVSWGCPRKPDSVVSSGGVDSIGNAGGRAPRNWCRRPGQLSPLVPGLSSGLRIGLVVDAI